jgi:uncharacterized protein YkwD
MDTQRFDHLSTVLTVSGTRRQALRTLTGVAAAVAAGALGANEGEAKKKRKKGKGKKGGNGASSGGINTGDQDGGGNTGGGGNGDGGGDTGGGNGDGSDGNSGGGGNTGGGSGTTQTEEEKLLGQINEFRAQNGLPALSRNGKLDTAAQNHSQDMANRGYFSHNSPEGTTADQRFVAAGYSFSWWGENIYKSAPGDASAQAAFTSWVNSSGHRANMLGSNFTQIGIGRATAADSRTLWTNTFGKPA